MHKAQVTIRDVAAKLGVSDATVSRALRGERRISLSTRRRPAPPSSLLTATYREPGFVRRNG